MKIKLTFLVLLYLLTCLFMSSCRYINPFDFIWSEERTMVGSTGDFFIAKSKEDIILQAVTPNGLSKSSITIPEFCTIEGQTYRITEFDYDAFNGWKSLKEVTVNNTSFIFGVDGFQDSTSLDSIIIGSNVPISNIIIDDYFLPLTSAPNIYLDNLKIKDILSSKAIGGVDRHNIYFKNGSGEYELFSKAYFNNESEAVGILLIIDIVAFVFILFLILFFSIRKMVFNKTKTSETNTSINNTSINKYEISEINLLRKYGIITSVIYIIGETIIKFLSLEFSPWVYGVHFLLPVALIYFCYSIYVPFDAKPINKIIKIALTILTVLSVIFICVKHFILGHYSLNVALVIETIIIVALALLLVFNVTSKWHIALYTLFLPIILVSMALIDYALIGITFALGIVGIIILAIIIIMFTLGLTTRGESITIYRN